MPSNIGQLLPVPAVSIAWIVILYTSDFMLEPSVQSKLLLFPDDFEICPEMFYN